MYDNDKERAIIISFCIDHYIHAVGVMAPFSERIFYKR